ncbi:HSP20 family molecular chaperone IbpA [Bradyrhizobium sp. F1.13.4]
MRTYDFSPLWRSTVGFDRLFDLVETAQRAGEDNYPPYNIESASARIATRFRWRLRALHPTRSR